MSHPPDSLLDMSYFDTSTTVDPYIDPVAYLAEHGIEAELVAVVTRLPEAA